MLTSFLRRLTRRARRDSGSFDGAVVYVCDTPHSMQITADRVLVPLQASLRLRVLIPARTIARRVPVWAVPPREFLDLARTARLGRPHCAVIAKMATASLKADRGTFEALLDWTASATIPLFADFCDNYADVTARTGSAFFASYQNRLAAQCRLIASCEALQRLLAPIARDAVEIIEDPFESAAAQPVREIVRSDLHLCWFGNLAPATLPPVQNALRAIVNRFTDRAIHVEFVAGAHQQGLVDAMAASLMALHRRFSLRFSAWSPASTAAAIERADIVLLPQDTGSGWGRVKSHNRIVEAIRGGRLAVASPIPSYVELRDYACIDEDLAAGIAWAVANPKEAAGRVARGQAYVEHRFSPERIGARWRQVLGTG